MALFRVRRGVEVYGGGEDSILVPISPAYTLGQTWPILGSHHATSAGYSPTASVDDTRDFSAWPTLTGNLDELRLDREPSAPAFGRVVPWELVEFLGDPTSADGFRVLATVSVRLLAGVTSKASTVIATPGDVGQVIPFLAGSQYAGGALPQDDSRKATLKIQADGRVLVERSASAAALTVRIAVVQFGAAWTIQNNIEHTFSAAGATETESISAVDWARTFVEGRVRGPGVGLDESGALIFPGSSTTIKNRLHAGATSPSSFSTVCHVASHPGLSVEHRDSVDGGDPDHGSSSLTVNVTVSSVDTSRTFLLGSNDCAGTGTAYPRQYWGFSLTAATTVQWSRSRSGQVSEWTLQVVELPDGLTLAPDPAVLELASPAPAVALELAPDPAVLELASPAPAVALELAPDPALLELASPSPAVALELVPDQAVLELNAPPATASSPTTIEITPDPAILHLSAPAIGLEIRVSPDPAVLELASPRAALDFPASCKVPFTQPALVELAVALPAAGLDAALRATGKLEADLPAASFAGELPTSQTVSVSLQVCP